MDKELKKAVFLDRDGTLIEEANYLSNPDDLRFFSFSRKAVELLRENGYLIIVVTNQSGIGRGFFDEAAMHRIHEAIEMGLENRIDAFYFCPHLPAADCRCRKPRIDLIERAASDFSVDPEKSWTIGDKVSDIETGFNAGTRTAFVLTGHGKNELDKIKRQPDIIADNLLEAVQKIVAVA